MPVKKRKIHDIYAYDKRIDIDNIPYYLGTFMRNIEGLMQDNKVLRMRIQVLESSMNKPVICFWKVPFLIIKSKFDLYMSKKYGGH